MNADSMPFVAIAIALAVMFSGVFVAIAAARRRGPSVTHIETRREDKSGD